MHQTFAFCKFRSLPHWLKKKTYLPAFLACTFARKAQGKGGMCHLMALTRKSLPFVYRLEGMEGTSDNMDADVGCAEKRETELYCVLAHCFTSLLDRIGRVGE